MAVPLAGKKTVRVLPFISTVSLNSFKDTHPEPWTTWRHDLVHFTLIKKENQIFLIYKEIKNGEVAKSYMTNGLLIYG
jgi:hypothetical protein